MFSGLALLANLVGMSTTVIESLGLDGDEEFIHFLGAIGKKRSVFFGVIIFVMLVRFLFVLIHVT
ncbi:hypothetical protein AMQ84_30435 [Paenibacillus riograndensis]|uniref:Uncharacterized protein n=1 Tax=Paenibacillus riograndensis TaxID=483937 RepID=A0A132TDB4_9BACL|nr:hypothetical protein AMQ84_30435 [Paenibacillus riograndensis]KWX83530.1 hypothetical protein AMQ83_31120 [Paenibacillus riograndensis]